MLHLLNSVGVHQRRARRFQRRQYYCPGPDFVWHLDGYDKLKPFGFAVHGCIDGFSRKLMWLQVASSNNDPAIIADYYLSCIGSLGYTAQKLRCDLGTENTTLKYLHPFLANDRAACVILGKSTANQRIEAWWCTLWKSLANWWMNLFKDLRDMNLYNDSLAVHVECLKFCFMNVIQSDLQAFMKQWNCHWIRRQHNCELPTGKPDVMYHAPQTFGTHSYKVDIDKHDAERCRLMFGKPRYTCTYLPEFKLLTQRVLVSLQEPSTATEALRLYFTSLIALQSIWFFCSALKTMQCTW